ncbi:MAG: nuclear transport factor 2 family protein [bacterium]|nr:nuclear transport factor 2 family protein [bacterium]
MKKIILCLFAVVLFSSLVFAGGDIEKDKAAIKKVILDAYRDGIVNVGDVEAIKKGFHPEFKLLGLNKDRSDIWKLPIADWAKSVEKGKKEGKYPPKEKVSFKFLLVDVVGNAGFAKIEFYKGDKLAYTDFLSLYRFKDGWKLVAKIYNQH